MAYGTLVDSNVLLDIMTEDLVWQTWSIAALSEAAESGPLYINPVIYSEVSIRFSTIEALEDALPREDYRREPIPWAAAFLAGKAFLNYRRNQGTKTTTLPDFFIGAHAAIANCNYSPETSVATAATFRRCHSSLLPTEPVVPQPKLEPLTR